MKSQQWVFQTANTIMYNYKSKLIKVLCISYYTQEVYSTAAWDGMNVTNPYQLTVTNRGWLTCGIRNCHSLLLPRVQLEQRFWTFVNTYNRSKFIGISVLLSLSFLESDENDDSLTTEWYKPSSTYFLHSWLRFSVVGTHTDKTFFWSLSNTYNRSKFIRYYMHIQFTN